MTAFRDAITELQLCSTVWGKDQSNWTRAARALAALVAEIEAASSGETLSYGLNKVTLETFAYIPAGTYKLVCIETPTGGREGEGGR